MPSAFRLCPDCGRHCPAFNMGLVCKSKSKPTPSPVKAVKRPSGLGRVYKWEATDPDGRVFAFIAEPSVGQHFHEWFLHGDPAGKPVRKYLRTDPRPKDWTKTLRRIKD